jgi:hypothetical protein
MAPTHIKLITKRSVKAYAEVCLFVCRAPTVPKREASSRADKSRGRRQPGSGKKPPCDGGRNSNRRHEAPVVRTQPGEGSVALRLAAVVRLNTARVSRSVGHDRQANQHPRWFLRSHLRYDMQHQTGHKPSIALTRDRCSRAGKCERAHCGLL